MNRINNKKTKSTLYILVAVLIKGILIAVMLGVILTLLLTIGIDKEVLNESTVNRMIFLIQLISVSGGCVMSMALLKNKKTMFSTLTMIGFIGVEFIVGIAVFKGSIQNYGNLLLSSALGFLLAYVIQFTLLSKKKYAIKHIR